MESKIIEINGLDLQCYFWGRKSNPPLFLLHGWLDTGAGFHFLCQKLAEDFYCIAPDMRGYGKSQHGFSPLGYFFFEYVADAYFLIKKLCPGKAVSLLGHSLGGAVASIVAGTYPEMIRHFINVEGFGFQRRDLQSGPARARRWLEGIGRQQFSQYASMEEFDDYLQATFPRIPRDRIEFLGKYLAMKEGEHYLRAADPNHKLLEPYAFPSDAFFPFWQNTTARSLFITAEKTEMAEYYPPGEWERTIKIRQKNFPSGCQLEKIDDCGHMVHYERPEILADLLIKFLKD